MADIRVYEFGSKECPYCAEQKEKGVMEKVARSHPDVKFVRVDSDMRIDLNTTYRINALPTYLIISVIQFGGRPYAKEIGRLEGAADPEQISALITQRRPFA